jgi:O-methyltransferase involved in polyketide biosynthesis
MPQVDVSQLQGVPETMLWGLYNRAAEARRPDVLLRDPLAMQIADAIAYDYARSFGRPESGQVVRALLTDQLLRAWLGAHRGGQVVALGEGLETQCFRVDDGHVRWMAVDLPEVIAVRRVLLPDSERHRNLACSALDPHWMDVLEPNRPLFVTAVGLLKYLQPHEVQTLVASIAERFPHAELAFDVMPHLLVWLTQQQRYRKGVNYVVPPMFWGLNRNELQTIRAWHPHIAEVREVPFVGGRGVAYRMVLPIIRRLPWVGNHLFALVHVRCGPDVAPPYANQV